MLSALFPLVSLWFAASVANNVYSKTVLGATFPFPYTLCAISLAVQGLGEWALGRWGSRQVRGKGTGKTVGGGGGAGVKWESSGGAAGVEAAAAAAVASHPLLVPLSIVTAAGFIFHRQALVSGPVALVLATKTTAAALATPALVWAALGRRPLAWQVCSA